MRTPKIQERSFQTSRQSMRDCYLPMAFKRENSTSVSNVILTRCLGQLEKPRSASKNSQIINLKTKIVGVLP